MQDVWAVRRENSSTFDAKIANSESDLTPAIIGDAGGRRTQ